MKNRELIHQLVDRVLDIQEQTEHYVSVEFNNYAQCISVWVQLGGWNRDGEYDLSESFSMEEEGNGRLMAVMKYLDGLLDAQGGDGHGDSNVPDLPVI